MGTQVMRIGGASLGFTVRVRGLDVVQRRFGNIARVERAIVQGFNDAAKILQQGVKDTFNKGVGPNLRDPSARIAGKGTGQTLVTTGAMRDAVVVTPVRTGRTILFTVGIPSGPLADRMRMHEFGPTSLPLSPARRNLLRSIGFNIPNSKLFVIIPRRPVFQIAANNPTTNRRMEAAITNRVLTALAAT